MKSGFLEKKPRENFPDEGWKRGFLAVAYLYMNPQALTSKVVMREMVLPMRSAATRRSISPLSAKPTFGNLLVWKTIYESEGMFYVDAVRVGLGSRHYLGAAIAKLDAARDLPWLQSGSQQARDLERFRWFSGDYLAVAGDVHHHRHPLLPGAQRNRRVVGHHPQPTRGAARARTLRRSPPPNGRRSGTCWWGVEKTGLDGKG